MTAESLTRNKAVNLINESIDNYTIFYEGYCNNNWNHLTGGEMEFYEQMHEVISILRNSEDYKNDLKNMPLGDLKEFFLMCRELVENNNLSSKSYFPKGDFEIAEDEETDTTIIEKSIKKLEQHGDAQIQEAVSEYRKGERAIRFDKMPQNQLGQTNRVNDFYCHSVSNNFIQDTPENEIQLAITLAHEFKRNAVTDSLEGETRDIVLSDTKIIESFAGTYGEEIYKKFPEYGILHYIKKIFGENELKDFADYAFDSSGSYWKVNEAGDLIDDGNTKKVFGRDGKEQPLEFESKNTGSQGTVEKWLGVKDAFTALLKSSGYKWNGAEWIENPGKIDHTVIEKAYEDGKLTEDQYNMVRLAAGKTASSENGCEKVCLFTQLLNDYQKANEMQTQIQVDIVNRAWEWVSRKWVSLFKKKENTASQFSTGTSFQKAISSKSVMDKLKEWSKIDIENKRQFDKQEEEKYQKARENGQKYAKKTYKPIPRCDEYSTEVLKAAGILPKDWPSPETTKVAEYWNKLSLKLKNNPEKGWNLMLMRSIDSKGNITGLSPHMAVLFVNDDSLISIAHYTNGFFTNSSGWTQKELEKDGKMINGVWHSKFNYTTQKADMKAFGYYPLGKI